MFGVMWSEHCCYKNSRPLLKQFPTTGDRILVGPGEKCGRHRSGRWTSTRFQNRISQSPLCRPKPFQGAATGVGGILRDIFTMGARPIAILNSLRFGDLKDAKTRRLFSGVVAGISHYGKLFCSVSENIYLERTRAAFTSTRSGILSIPISPPIQIQPYSRQGLKPHPSIPKPSGAHLREKMVVTGKPVTRIFRASGRHPRQYPHVPGTYPHRHPRPSHATGRRGQNSDSLRSNPTRR